MNEPGTDRDASPRIAPIPDGLTAIGAGSAPFVPALALDKLPEGAMRRVTFGDLDVLLAHTGNGIAAVDDRCPHMAAPLSIGSLEDCIVGCPLHDGRFDLASGDVERMPTTGGLLPDGTYVPVWTPEGNECGASVITRFGSTTAGSRSRSRASPSRYPRPGAWQPASRSR